MDDFNFEQFLISIGSTLVTELIDEEYGTVQKLYKLSIPKDEEKLYFLFSHDQDDDDLDSDGFTIFNDYHGNEIEKILKPYLKTNNFEDFDADEEIGEYTCYSGLPPLEKSFAKELIEHLGRFSL